MQQQSDRSLLTHFYLSGVSTLLLLLLAAYPQNEKSVQAAPSAVIDTSAVIALANQYLQEAPVTITAYPADQSVGGLHDYYSEGPYWWPDPDNPDGPYIRRDGERNPERFVAHKQVLNEMVTMVTTLTAAYELSGERRYAEHALRHLAAWFIDPDTRMHPSLLHGQAIKGISTGRGIGIIDTVPLIQLARSLELLLAADIGTEAVAPALRQWFADYGDWLNTHPQGIAERDHGNNHSTWWGAQLAAYARVAQRPDLLQAAQAQFKRQLDQQMQPDGSFPDELSRTRPWGYTLYNLRAWTLFCTLASTPEEDLWTYTGSTGNLRQAVDLAASFLQTPGRWPYATDLEPKLEPLREPFLLFAAAGWQEPKYRELWKSLPKEDDTNQAKLVLWPQMHIGHDK